MPEQQTKPKKLTITRFWRLSAGRSIGSMPGRSRGDLEAALQHNHFMHDPKQPIEILRTIHSFDPCIACAVHVTDPDGEDLVQVKIK